MPQKKFSKGIIAEGGIIVGSAETGNYLHIDIDGALFLHGDATVYEDLRVPVSSTKLGGTKDPDFSVYKVAAGSSQGVFLYFFDAGTEEELYFDAQLSHMYRLGTSVTPHVHWVSPTGGSAGETVSWGLEYTFAGIGEQFPSPSIMYSNTRSAGDSAIVADKHYLTALGSVPIAASGVSAMLICRIFRDATSTGCADTFDDDAGLLEVDFHMELDSIGSRQLFTK